VNLTNCGNKKTKETGEQSQHQNYIRINQSQTLQNWWDNFKGFKPITHKRVKPKRNVLPDDHVQTFKKKCVFGVRTLTNELW
jgi:hypothetical protein